MRISDKDIQINRAIRILESLRETLGEPSYELRAVAVRREAIP